MDPNTPEGRSAAAAITTFVAGFDAGAVTCGALR
jgi:hypothetical protein